MELHQFFLMLAVLLLAARFLSEVSARAGIPRSSANSPPGLSLGHRYWAGCRRMQRSRSWSKSGSFCSSFEVGMDTDVFRLARAGAKPFAVAFAGIVLPLGLGFALLLDPPRSEVPAAIEQAQSVGIRVG